MNSLYFKKVGIPIRLTPLFPSSGFTLPPVLPPRFLGKKSNGIERPSNSLTTELQSHPNFKEWGHCLDFSILFNPLKKIGESFRVFPISNWTELNVWEYIEHEDIPVVPLYFAKKRKVVSRDNSLFLIDDDRFRLNEEDEILEINMRFRTLGCYPLTSGIKSNAKNVLEIIQELKETAFSERSGRLIDYDKHGSMELKKREGYF